MQSTATPRFLNLEKIGQGTYGNVFKAFDSKTNRTVAIKKMKIPYFENYGIPATTLREMTILSNLQSKYVVELIEIILDVHRILFIFEFIETDLKKFIEISPKEFPFPEAFVKVGLSENHEGYLFGRTLHQLKASYSQGPQTTKHLD